MHALRVLDFLNIDRKVPENIDKQYNQIVRFKAPASLILKNHRITHYISKFALRWAGSTKLVEFFVDKNAKKPRITKADEIFLDDLYREDVKKLENLLGRSLPWNLDSSVNGGGGLVRNSSGMSKS